MNNNAIAEALKETAVSAPVSSARDLHLEFVRRNCDKVMHGDAEMARQAIVDTCYYLLEHGKEGFDSHMADLLGTIAAHLNRTFDLCARKEKKADLSSASDDRISNFESVSA